MLGQEITVTVRGIRVRLGGYHKWLGRAIELGVMLQGLY